MGQAGLGDGKHKKGKNDKAPRQRGALLLGRTGSLPARLRRLHYRLGGQPLYKSIKYQWYIVGNTRPPPGSSGKS